MQIPRKETWTKEDIIEYMKNCAKQYVPEWQYNLKNPDAGTALLSLFADMMYDTVKQFNLSAARDMFSFFDEVHAKMLPAQPAKGFITFELAEGFEGEEEILHGTKLLAETENGPVVFETQKDLFVRQINLKNIYLFNPLEDAIYEVYNRQQEVNPSFFLFQNKGENLQQHKIIFCFSHGLEILTKAKAKLSFQITGKEVKSQELEQAFQEETGIRFSYGTATGYQPIEKEYKENTIYFDITGGKDGIVAKEESQFFYAIDRENEIAIKKESPSFYIIQAEILDAELFSKVYLSSLALSVSSQNLKPDFIHVNGIDQEIEDFLVFGRTPSVYDEFYIVSEEVFGKAGAQIQIEFDLDFVRMSLELAEEKKISWKTVMEKREFIPDQEYDISIHEVVWEYYNGHGWTRLSEGTTYRHLFSAEENLGGQRVRMEFMCPLDISRVLVNASKTYAIRARVLSVNNAYKTRGAYIAPVAGRFSLSYHYDKNPLKPVQIIKWNNLKKEIISERELQQEGFSTAFCNKIKDKKTAYYLGFEQPLTGGPLRFLFTMQHSMQQNMPAIEWEYWTKDGWKAIHPMDETNGFRHTGLVSWIGNSDILRRNLFEQNLFWIRLVDIEDSYRNKVGRYPKIEGIYPNSVPILGVETKEEQYGIAPYAQEKKIKLPFTDLVDVKVWVLEGMDYRQSPMQQIWKQWKETEELCKESSERREFTIDRQIGVLTFPKYMNISCFNKQGEITVCIRYTYCQGEKGNLKAGAINLFEQSNEFIQNSYNPIASVGGIPREKALEAVKRNAQVLRHGYRCVSAKDYEDMALEATRNISKIKCFSGYNQEGKRKSGAVTLAVLPKDYEENAYSFEIIKTQIYKYLSSHMDENILYFGNFSIVQPELVQVNVEASIELLEESEIFPVRKKILEESEKFLNPINGNFYGEGWEIGTMPSQDQIAHALKRVKGVKQVKHLTVHKFCQGYLKELERKEFPFYLLPKSGTIQIGLD